MQTEDLLVWYLVRPSGKQNNDKQIKRLLGSVFDWAYFFNRARIEEQLNDESLYATDLVYYLVAKKVPFAQAHTIVGRLINYSLANSLLIKDMPEAMLKRFSNRFTKKEILGLFNPGVSVNSKRSIRKRK